MPVTLYRSLQVVVAAVVLAGCAVVDKVPLGTARDDVIKVYGTPTQTIQLPNGGARLQYAFQPMGRKMVVVEVDAAGRVASVRQVLSEVEFARIEVGKWTRADVEREFGSPSLINHVGNWQGDIMTYRWRDTVGTDMFYWVYLDDNNVAQQVGQGMEFRDNFMWGDR